MAALDQTVRSSVLSARVAVAWAERPCATGSTTARAARTSRAALDREVCSRGFWYFSNSKNQLFKGYIIGNWNDDFGQFFSYLGNFSHQIGIGTLFLNINQYNLSIFQNGINLVKSFKIKLIITKHPNKYQFYEIGQYRRKFLECRRFKVILGFKLLA